MQNRFFYAIFGITMAISGCSSSGSTDSATPTEEVISTFDGQWRADCEFNGTDYIDIRFEMSNGRYDSTFGTYTDSDCSILSDGLTPGEISFAIANISAQGPFFGLGEFMTSDGISVDKIDFIRESVQIQGQEVDPTTLGLGTDSRFRQIVYRQDEVIYLGNLDMGLDNEGRPTIIFYEQPLRYVEP